MRQGGARTLAIPRSARRGLLNPMGVHQIRYLVDPPTACPAPLMGPTGQPAATCEVDTAVVARCAMAEVLQTGPNAGPMSLLFDEHLVSGHNELVWKGSGPGRGTEMRRAFSGLFGRFFARAYLQYYHGFTWFAPIDGVQPISLPVSGYGESHARGRNCRIGSAPVQDFWRSLRPKARIKRGMRPKAAVRARLGPRIDRSGA